MTINEQIKILDNKIRSNQAQYDLDRQNAKISALSSGELDKYEYLTGEDLGYKPGVVQKAKFEYSPLGQVFNKGLKTDENNEGLLKELKKSCKKEQDELWGLILKMKKKIGKKKSRSRKLNKSGKNDMNKLIKDANKTYKTRNDIIRAFENKKLIEPDFEWINNTDVFNKVLDRANENIGIEARSDDKVFSFKKVRKFLDDIMSGNAEKEYVEKIMNDENLLRSYKGFSKTKNAQ